MDLLTQVAASVISGLILLAINRYKKKILSTASKTGELVSRAMASAWVQVLLFFVQLTFLALSGIAATYHNLSPEEQQISIFQIALSFVCSILGFITCIRSAKVGILFSPKKGANDRADDIEQQGGEDSAGKTP